MKWVSCERQDEFRTISETIQSRQRTRPARLQPNGVVIVLVRRTSVLLLIAIGLAAPAAGQTVTDTRIWTTFTAQGHLSSPWRWTSDSLVRSRNGARTMDFVAQRVLVSRDLTRNASGGIGYAYGAGFPDEGSTVREHRFVQQFVWSGWARTLSLKSRVEERFIDGNGGMLVRVRQQVRVSWPIGNGGRLALVASEEVLVHANSRARSLRGFDSNRVFTGIRHAVSTRGSVEIGYVNLYTHLGTRRHRRSHVLSATYGVTF
jgi:Protein of unknown function (DUF2490)